MYLRNGGLGAVWTADGTSFSFPWWCNDVLSETSLFESCKPPTDAQLTAMQQAQLSKIAIVNPAAAQQSIIQGNLDTQAYCAVNPADCAAYQAAPKEGSSVLQVLFGNNFNPLDPSTFNGLVWVILAGLGVLLVVPLLGGRR